MFASSRSMIHGTNTQRLLLFQEQKKRHLEEEQQVQHILLCQHKQSRKATFPPRQLWLCGGAGRCQRFSENNVTRRGIPVRPRKRGGRGGSPNRAGQLTSPKPALAPSRGSFSRSPPSLAVFVSGGGGMWCGLPTAGCPTARSPGGDDLEVLAGFHHPRKANKLFVPSQQWGCNFTVFKVSISVNFRRDA